MDSTGPNGVDNLCIGCAGAGEINGEFHYSCLGTGYIGRMGEAIFLKKMRDDTMDKLNDIKEKVDEIKAVVDAL